MRSADAADQYVAGLYTGAHANNLIGSTASPTSVTTAAGAYEQLVDLGVLLTQSKVPTSQAAGRSCHPGFTV
jgi:hypothetical protein